MCGAKPCLTLSGTIHNFRFKRETCNEMNELAFEIELNDSYPKALERVIQCLKAEGFGVLTRIDIDKAFKEKIGETFRPYAILGACNPALAHQALQSELEVGLLLPCNVIVYEAEGGSVISIVDPLAMLGVAANPELATVAEEARTRLKRVNEALSR